MAKVTSLVTMTHKYGHWAIVNRRLNPNGFNKSTLEIHAIHYNLMLNIAILEHRSDRGSEDESSTFASSFPLLAVRLIGRCGAHFLLLYESNIYFSSFCYACR